MVVPTLGSPSPYRHFPDRRIPSNQLSSCITQLFLSSPDALPGHRCPVSVMLGSILGFVTATTTGIHENVQGRRHFLLGRLGFTAATTTHIAQIRVVVADVELRRFEISNLSCVAFEFELRAG